MTSDDWLSLNDISPLMASERSISYKTEKYRHLTTTSWQVTSVQFIWWVMMMNFWPYWTGTTIFVWFGLTGRWVPFFINMWFDYAPLPQWWLFVETVLWYFAIIHIKFYSTFAYWNPIQYFPDLELGIKLAGLSCDACDNYFLLDLPLRAYLIHLRTNIIF